MLEAKVKYILTHLGKLKLLTEYQEDLLWEFFIQKVNRIMS